MNENPILIPFQAKDKSTPVQEASWTTWDTIRMSAGAVVILLVAVFGFSVFTNGLGLSLVEREQPTLLMNAALAALEGLALTASVYLLGLRWRRLSWRSIGFRPAPRSWIIGSFVLALAFIPLVGLVAYLIQILLGLPTVNSQLPFLAPGDFSIPGSISMLLLGGILVPIAEEIFFRGVIFRWLRSKVKPWFAIILSALIFGVLHGDIAIAGATALMGIVLAWVYEKTGSLWPSITIHIVNNSFKLILLYALLAAGIDITSL